MIYFQFKLGHFSCTLMQEQAVKQQVNVTVCIYPLYNLSKLVLIYVSIRPVWVLGIRPSIEDGLEMFCSLATIGIPNSFFLAPRQDLGGISSF